MGPITINKVKNNLTFKNMTLKKYFTVELKYFSWQLGQF